MSTLPYKYEEYKTFVMSQREGVCEVFKFFLDKEDFDIVIEIGTWFGGFAYMLSDLLGKKFHTYDISDNTLNGVRENILSNNSHIHIEDVFKSYSIINLIKSDGKTLLLCDGGNKTEEIKVFSAMLKPNDVIMAHDFFVSKETHNPNYWRSCEVTTSDFNYNYLKEYKEYTDMFIPYVWGIRIKI